MLGEKTFSQLSDEQLFWQFNEECNSIGSIMKHDFDIAIIDRLKIWD